MITAYFALLPVFLLPLVFTFGPPRIVALFQVYLLFGPASVQTPRRLAMHHVQAPEVFAIKMSIICARTINWRITCCIGIVGHARYDTEEAWEGSADLSYTISKSVDIVGRYHSEYGLGAGVQVCF
jgi:hypothetical protein